MKTSEEIEKKESKKKEKRSLLVGVSKRGEEKTWGDSHSQPIREERERLGRTLTPTSHTHQNFIFTPFIPYVKRPE